MWGQSLKELFLRGGPVMWPLLACSVLGVALILERTVILLWVGVRFEPLVRWLRQLVVDGKIEEARQRLSGYRGPVARVAAVYLQLLYSAPSLREEVVSREASQQLAFLERRLGLLGLLGTVIGLMTMFHQMELKGTQVQTSDLAVGIWQKLLNTAFGMVIAVPCLVAYYWLEGRVGVVTLQMEWITSYLKEWLDTATPQITPHGQPSHNGGLPSMAGLATPLEEPG